MCVRVQTGLLLVKNKVRDHMMCLWRVCIYLNVNNIHTVSTEDIQTTLKSKCMSSIAAVQLFKFDYDFGFSQLNKLVLIDVYVCSAPYICTTCADNSCFLHRAISSSISSFLDYFG